MTQLEALLSSHDESKAVALKEKLVAKLKAQLAFEVSIMAAPDGDRAQWWQAGYGAAIRALDEASAIELLHE